MHGFLSHPLWPVRPDQDDLDMPDLVFETNE